MIGSTLGKKYQIVEKLREQRFYDVYAARVMNTENRSIIKILRPEYVTPSKTLQSMRPSLGVVAALRHPGIAQLRDFDEDEQFLFFAEEYYEGTLLAEILNTGSSLNSLQTLELGIKIVEALSHAHGKGVVHGLLSPDSVVILNNLGVKLSDFYSLAALTSGMNINGGGKQGRDVRYCAPEVITGIAPSYQSDIFAAGVILYEIMTGRLPYTPQQSMEMALDKDYYTPIPPAELNPRVPPLLNSVIMKALKPKPASRYDTASELLSELLLCRSSMMRAISAEGAPVTDATDTPLTGRRNTGGYAPPARRATAQPRRETGPEAGGEETAVTSVLEEADVESKKFKKRLAIAIGSGVVFVAALVILLVVVFKPLLGPGGKALPMPDVSQKDVTQAKSILGLQGLQTTVVEEFNDEVPAGLVIRQDPTAGAEVKQGSIIVLYVSKGQEQKGVPDFKGKNERDAEKQITEMGYKVGEKKYDYSDTYTQGQVMDQRPAAGEQRPVGTIINLVVSKGSETNVVAMPNLIGMKIDDARKALADAQIPLGDISGSSEGGESYIIAQSVPAGTQIDTKTMQPVGITVSGQSPQPQETETPPGEDVLNNGAQPPPTVTEKVKSQKINISITGSGSSELVVKVSDKYNPKAREVYHKTQKKGDKVSIPVNGVGKVHVQVLINGEVQKELDF